MYKHDLFYLQQASQVCLTSEEHTWHTSCVSKTSVAVLKLCMIKKSPSRFAHSCHRLCDLGPFSSHRRNWNSKTIFYFSVYEFDWTFAILLTVITMFFAWWCLPFHQINYAAMDAIVAVDIFTHLVLAKATGLDPRLCPQSASAVSVEKFLSTSRSLCQGIMDAHYVRKTDANTVYTEVSEMGGCLSFCKMYRMLSVCKTNPNMVYTEVSEMGWCLSICSMSLDAHNVCKTNPNTVYTEMFEMGWCLSFCKMHLGAHPVRKTNASMVPAVSYTHLTLPTSGRV